MKEIEKKICKILIHYKYDLPMWETTEDIAKQIIQEAQKIMEEEHQNFKEKLDKINEYVNKTWYLPYDKADKLKVLIKEIFPEFYNSPQDKVLRLHKGDRRHNEEDTNICVNCGKIREHHYEYDLCNALSEVGDDDYGKKFKPQNKGGCGHGLGNYICQECKTQNKKEKKE